MGERKKRLDQLTFTPPRMLKIEIKQEQQKGLIVINKIDSSLNTQ